MSEDSIDLVCNDSGGFQHPHPNGYNQITFAPGQVRSFGTSLAYYLLSKAGKKLAQVVTSAIEEKAQGRARATAKPAPVAEPVEEVTPDAAE